MKKFGSFFTLFFVILFYGLVLVEKPYRFLVCICFAFGFVGRPKPGNENEMLVGRGGESGDLVLTIDEEESNGGSGGERVVHRPREVRANDGFAVDLTKELVGFVGLFDSAEARRFCGLFDSGSGDRQWQRWRGRRGEPPLLQPVGKCGFSSKRTWTRSRWVGFDWLFIGSPVPSGEFSYVVLAKSWGDMVPRAEDTV